VTPAKSRGLRFSISDFDRNNPVRARSGGCEYQDIVTFPVSHYALAHRRVNRQLAFGYVGFPRANHPVSVDLTGFQILYSYCRSKTYLFKEELAANDYFTNGELFFQIVDSFLEVRMPLTRQHELLVLNFYAIAPGLAQFIQDFGADNTPEMGQLS